MNYSLPWISQKWMWLIKKCILDASINQLIKQWLAGCRLVLEALERMSHHLTAAVVSNDPRFLDEVLGSTVNGTQYVGRRARTTGAPQNHCT